jgi:rRNA maturation RNase YbeY
MLEKGSVEFHFQYPEFPLEMDKIRKWFHIICSMNNSTIENLNCIFCTDEEILEINRNYLNHDYYTDIITFPFQESPIVADLYISVDRIKEHAVELGINMEEELLRVLIHGLLHMLGYNDKTKEEIQKIREAEDRAIALFQRDFRSESHYYDKVYDVVRMIPPGKVTTYGAIANFLTLGSARMVGWALNQLKGSLSDVPAHRVVNARGELSGKLFFGPDKMKQLLQSEGVLVSNDKIDNMEGYYWDPYLELK